MSLTKVQKEGIETLINNNADNRVITGSSTANTLNGESALTFDGARLHLNSGNSGLPKLRLQHTGAGNDVFEITSGLIGVSNSGFGIYDVDASAYRLAIDSSGHLLVNTTSVGGGSYDQLSVAGGIKITDDSNSKLEIGRYSSGAPNSYIKIGSNSNSLRITNASDNSDLFTVNNDGKIGIGTSPQTPLHVYHATSNESIRCESGDEYVHIVFKDSTTTNEPYIGAQGNNLRAITGGAERIRLNSSGNVGINQTNPNKARLHVVGDDTDGDIIAKFKSGAGSANTTAFIALIAGYPDTANDLEGHAYIGVQRSGSGNNTKILFQCYNGGSSMTTRMTISEGGNVDIQGKIHTQLGTQINSFNKETTGDQIRFNTQGTTRGSISSNGSTVSYNTTSDYRLKENEVAISDAITRLKALKPYRFNFKEQPSLTVDGFFAHEVAPVIPEAVNGEKDAMAPLYYEEGDTLPEGKEIGDYKGLSTTEIQPQGLDQSKLVPLLTAALQEAVGKIEVLETKVAALEVA